MTHPDFRRGSGWGSDTGALKGSGRLRSLRPGSVQPSLIRCPVRATPAAPVSPIQGSRPFHHEPQGLLVSIQHRLSSGFTVLTNYTWSHCIGDGEFNGDLRGPYYQNPFDRAADRGNCNFDRTHVFNASIVALSPFKGGDWKGRLLGNWQFAPLLQVRSGGTINVTTGTDNSLSGEGLDRPNVAAGQSPYGTDLIWLNKLAFEANPAGTFGNVGRNTLRGPAFMGFDLALSQLFALHEQVKLEARLEAFNAVNYVNLNNPASNLNSSSFGKITSAGDPRILQIAMKLHF